MPILQEHLPKYPKQERGWRKFELILTAASDMICERGVHNLSIPNIATRAKIPLSSVYQFFPTPQAILVELAKRHNDKLNEQLVETLLAAKLTRWEDIFTIMIDVVVNYSRANAVAQDLFLSPIVPKEIMAISTDADEKLNTAILELLPQEIIEALLLAPEGIDPIRVTIEIVLTVFSVAFRTYGEITDYAVAEAKRAGISYLQSYLRN